MNTALHTAQISRFAVAPVRSATHITRSKASEDIYIGKGRYVKDDPSKYPSRDELCGGWSGGERGLQEFLKKQGGGSTKATKTNAPATKLLGGNESIYTGQGNYVRDNSVKYPSRTELSGGFAGGERGVSQYVTKGDLEFNSPGEFRNQYSPLIVALGIALGAIVVSLIWFNVEPPVSPL